MWLITIALLINLVCNADEQVGPYPTPAPEEDEEEMLAMI